MLELSDVENMVRLFTSGLETNTVSNSNWSMFEIPMFGTQVFFFDNYAVLSGTRDNSWRIVDISPKDVLEEKRMELFWELMRSGYVHYLRTELPRTFRAMVSQQGWDKKIINKRLELYGNDAKYNYYREIDRWALRESTGYVLSTYPGFFDCLPY